MTRHQPPPATRWQRRGRRRRAAGAQRGSAPIELAIVALPMLLLGFAVVQTGLVYHARCVAMAAATQAVNAERGYQAEPGSGRAQAHSFLASAGAGLTGPQVEVIRDADDVSVTVTGHAIAVLPGLAWPVSRTAHGPVERVTTP